MGLYKMSEPFVLSVARHPLLELLDTEDFSSDSLADQFIDTIQWTNNKGVVTNNLLEEILLVSNVWSVILDGCGTMAAMLPDGTKVTIVANPKLVKFAVECN